MEQLNSVRRVFEFKAALPDTSPGDARNDSLVMRESSRWIHRINCLEMLLVGIQNDRIGLLKQSTEFTAFVLQSKDGRRLRIYYYTRNFRFGQTDLNAVVSPSLPDAQLSQTLAAKYQMREIWITNGLHTARIPASAFGRLQSAP
jgi:hypothetical protein